LENWDNALRDYNRAIELQPTYPMPYYARGAVHKLNKRNNEALRDFEKFIELNGNKGPLASEVNRLIEEIKNPIEQ
jgi:tetratricopeptide (TPR) repeat protein